MKQHSRLGNLKVDYANRATLAQSYQHIIEDGQKDPALEQLKKEFLTRVVGIFTEKATTHDGKTIPEAIAERIWPKGK